MSKEGMTGQGTATDFKYDTRVESSSLHMIHKKGGWPGSHDLKNIWALSANSSKMDEFTFGLSLGTCTPSPAVTEVHYERLLVLKGK